MTDRSVFGRLKRLFSTDVIIRNDGNNNLKIFDINKIQVGGDIETNSLVDRYSRIYNTTNPTSLYGAQVNSAYQYRRTFLYSEYDMMDNDAIIASSLDIIADECTISGDMNEVLHIKSTDENIQKTLYNLFYDILNIDFNMWSWIRQMCKYGDFFLKLEIADKIGVYNVIPYSAFHIQREEGFDPENPYSIRYQYLENGATGFSNSGYYSYNQNSNTTNEKGIYFDNFEMAHLRLISDSNYLPYGRSYLEPARKLYKQYSLMEDAMLIHRIVRAPQKRVFYINVGSLPPNEIEPFMQKTISNMKRVPVVDPETGEYNLRYNIQNSLEDFYIPMRGNDTSTKIDNVPGLEYTAIDDVKYLRDKLFAALKVPKEFLGYTENTEGKSTLSALDIRFSRTIDRIQKIVVSELYKIALVHLYTQGYKEDSLTNFELSLNSPSIIYEQEKINLMKEKVELAGSMMEKQLFPTDYIYENIFHMSEEQYSGYRDLISEDFKRAFRNEQIKQEGNDPLVTGTSFGTPHDLASLYGTKDQNGKKLNKPPVYDENLPIGRPEEKASNIGTQDNTFGVDRFGMKQNKDMYDKKLTHTFKGGSPLALENRNSKYYKSQSVIDSLKSKKQLLKEDSDKGTILDEKNIKFED